MTEGVIRRYTFKLYPNKAQAEALDSMRRLHCTLYNAALQERIDAYRLAGETLGHFDQAKSIKIIRADDPAYEALSADSLSFTLKRLDMAYQAFFRRAKAGAGFQSGFPRYKRGDDYAGFTHRPGKGWRFDVKPNAGSGRTTFKGVPGAVKWRGEFPMFPYGIKTGDVMLRAGTWWLSVVADLPARMRADHDHSGEVSFDLVDSFARVSRANSGHSAGPEETVFAAAHGRITPVVSEGYGGSAEVTTRMRGDGGVIHVAAMGSPADVTPRMRGDGGCDPAFLTQVNAEVTPRTEGDNGQTLSGTRTKRGSYKDKSDKRREARRQAGAARQRRESLHVWTTTVAREFATLKITSPPLVEATKSGRGNKYEPGAEVELKASLNRRVLDQAPGFAIAMLEYKVAERGGTTETVVAVGPVLVGNEIVEARKANRKARKAARS